GLGEQLAPADLAGEHRPQEAGLLLIGAPRVDRRAGEGDEERRRVLGLGAGLAQTALDVAVEVRADTAPTEARVEVHPGQAVVEAGAAERDPVVRLGIACGEQCVDRCVDLGGGGVGGSVNVSHAGILPAASPAEQRGASSASPPVDATSWELVGS